MIFVSFTGDEIEDYNQLIQIAGETSAQKKLKEILHAYLK